MLVQKNKNIAYGTLMILCGVAEKKHGCYYANLCKEEVTIYLVSLSTGVGKCSHQEYCTGVVNLVYKCKIK